MYVNKWYTLAASAVLQLTAGVAYTFSLYAPSLKAALHLSQPQLEGIGSAILCGGLTAWAPGLLYDYLAGYDKLAPRLTAGIGVAAHVAGYTTIWAAASGRVDLPFWFLVIAGLVASSGLLWLDTAAIVTSMRNFPTERGSIAGILKTFLGLSASIATTVFGGVFAPHGIDFLLFLAVGPAALGLLAVPLMNYVPYIEDGEAARPGERLTPGRRLLAICGVICALLLYQMLTALLGSGTHSEKLGVMIAALAILAASVVMIPIGTGPVRSQPARVHGGEGTAALESAPLLPGLGGTEKIQRRAASAGLEDGGEGEAPAGEGDGRRERLGTPPRELTLPQCLVSADYYMLWLALFVGIGSGFTLLNNFGQHVEALGMADGSQQTYVLLFATFNCLGRMACGFGSEWLLHRYTVPRTAVLLAMSAWTAVVYFGVAVAGPRLLLACAGPAGLAFGAHWALMPATTADLFGTRHFAANQSGMHLSTAVGALLLSTELAGTLFEARGRAHGDPRGACIGADCFRSTYAIIGGIALLQTALSTVLFFRSRRLYRHLHVRLRRQEAEARG